MVVKGLFRESQTLEGEPGELEDREVGGEAVLDAKVEKVYK
jgi:hypothetical protein